jgi:hypothetical protein
MNGSPISTRIPEVFNPAGATDGEGVYAWEDAGSGDIRPSGASGLSSGQAWEDAGSGNIRPTGATITDDTYWQAATGSDIKPV